MRRFVLILFVFLFIQVSLAPPNNGKRRNPRFIQNWFPFRLFSNIFGWLFDSGSDTSSSSTGAKNNYEQNSMGTTPAISFGIFDSIGSLVSKTSSVASNTFFGFRERVSSSLNSFSDFLVNKIPYAEETTKIPNKHLPKYAEGKPIPEYDHAVVHDRKYEQRNGILSNRKHNTPEQVYQGFVKREEQEMGKYDLYYNIKDTDFQNVKDYEQFLEKEKWSSHVSSEEDPIAVLMMMYDRVEKSVKDHPMKGGWS